MSVSNGYLYFPLPQANTEKRAYAEDNLETGRIERVFEDWDVMSSQIVNLDGVLHYFRAGVGLCEYDKASNQESVKFPMDVYCAEVSYTSPSWNTPPPMPFTSPPTAGPSPTTSTPTTWTAWS